MFDEMNQKLQMKMVEYEALAQGITAIDIWRIYCIGEVLHSDFYQPAGRRDN